MKPRFAISCLALTFIVGCSRSPVGVPSAMGQVLDTPPFLGVPEDGIRKIEEENPDIDSRLRGATTMTAVEATDYTTFLWHKKEGRITTEEIREGFVYYAVSEGRHAPLAGGVAGAASGAYFTLVSRYKAPIPKFK